VEHKDEIQSLLPHVDGAPHEQDPVVDPRQVVVHLLDVLVVAMEDLDGGFGLEFLQVEIEEVWLEKAKEGAEVNEVGQVDEVLEAEHLLDVVPGNRQKPPQVFQALGADQVLVPERVVGLLESLDEKLERDPIFVRKNAFP